MPSNNKYYRLYLGLFLVILASPSHRAGVYYVSVPIAIAAVVLLGSILKKELGL